MGRLGTQWDPVSNKAKIGLGAMRLTRFLVILLFRKHPQTTDDADDAAGHKSFMCATIQTGFCDWSARYFAQPVMKVSMSSWPQWNLGMWLPQPQCSHLKLKSSCCLLFAPVPGAGLGV